MNNMMTFPDTWEEFEKIYGFDDSEEVYTNGSRLVPSFRVKQWLEHIAQFKTKQQAIKASDLIYRQDAINAVHEEFDEILCWDESGEYTACEVERVLDGVLSAEPVKAYTKADYIMALHKEYGCTLTMAKEAHNKALEYLRSKAMMKG